MNIACILMAAGAGTRFGGNKLLAELSDKPLYTYALDAIPDELLWRVAVVSGEEAILKEARQRGFTPVLNDKPEEGVSRTIRMGLDAVQGADAAMFMVCDQPLLRRETVAALIRAYGASPGHIVCLGNGERRGNPAIFPGKFFASLYALTGDRGGSDVIRANASSLIIHQVSNPRELFDADSREELGELTIDN